MKPGVAITVAGVALAVAVGMGYWLGRSVKPWQTQSAATPMTSAIEAVKKSPKLLYYRNPMGLPDTSSVPKKDPMGIDYIAVFDGESGDESAAVNLVKISTDKVQKLGVRTELVQLRTLDRVIRAAGRVEPDERRQFAIAPKFEGYVERL